MPRRGLSQEIERWEPEQPFSLDGEMLLTCLRKSRRGAAAGPSCMTADHLFPILENELDSSLFVQAATSLAKGNIPEVIMEAIRLGQMTALRKPDGGVRGIVVGDIVRRLVARTIAKQVSKQATLLPSSTPCQPKDASVCRTHSASDDGPRQSSNRGPPGTQCWKAS